MLRCGGIDIPRNEGISVGALSVVVQPLHTSDMYPSTMAPDAHDIC